MIKKKLINKLSLNLSSTENYEYIHVRKHQIDNLDLLALPTTHNTAGYFSNHSPHFFPSNSSVCQIQMKYKSHTKTIEILWYLQEHYSFFILLNICNWRVRNHLYFSSPRADIKKWWFTNICGIQDKMSACHQFFLKVCRHIVNLLDFVYLLTTGMKKCSFK